MGKRGPQPGSGGRPPKPLSEKLLEGNPGKRKLKVLKSFQALEAGSPPEPRDYLSAQEKDGSTFKAAEYFVAVWRWLDERGVAQHVSPELIEHYSLAAARHEQCEHVLSSYGMLAKNGNGGAVISPYVEISLMYLKYANAFWNQISQIVKENCSETFKPVNSSDDMMSLILSS